MWATRCLVVHPNGRRGLSLRQKTSDECASELGRPGLKDIPITKRFYVGLPPSKRTPLIAQWKIAFLTPERTFLDN